MSHLTKAAHKNGHCRFSNRLRNGRSGLPTGGYLIKRRPPIKTAIAVFPTACGTAEAASQLENVSLDEGRSRAPMQPIRGV